MGEGDRVVDRGRRGDAIEVKQLVGREPQDVEHVAVELVDGPLSGPRDGMIERRAPAQRAEHDFGGEALIALVGEAGTAGFEGRGQIGMPRMHPPERVERHHPRDRRHGRQARPAGEAGAGSTAGASNRRPASTW